MDKEVQVKNLKMGALWKNTTKDGREYYSGKVEMDISVWPNSFKVEGDNKPDLVVQHRAPKPKEFQAKAQTNNQQQFGQVEQSPVPYQTDVRF